MTRGLISARASYTHLPTVGANELRDRTQGGTVLYSFSDQTPVAELAVIFRGL